MRARLPLIFILITLVIDAMGIGLILPVMPDLLQEIGGGDLGDAAIWGGILSASFAAMQFLFGPLMGNISDHYGRRPVLLISLFVMGVDYLVMTVAGSIWLLVVARLVAGITAATQTTAAAYMADISSKEERAARFGLISAAFGVGFILGPMIGGLLGEYGARMPFMAAAALAFLNVGIGVLVLPETLPPEKRRRFDWRRANPIGAFLQMDRLPGVRPLLIAFFLFEFALQVYPVIWAYFTHARFGWGTASIGASLTVWGVSIVFIQGVCIRPILRRWGEHRTIFAGLVFSLFSYVIVSVISNGTAMLVLIPVSALGVIALPAMQGLMSKNADPDQQGELQGAITSTRSVAVILSPIVMTRVFAFATDPTAPFFLPGAPFLVSALLMALCALTLWKLRTPDNTPLGS